MADEKTVDQVPDSDLFEKATTPPVAPEPPAPPAEPEVKEAAAPEPPAKPEPPAPPEPPEPTIPPWRLREEAEARRLAEDRARMLEQRLNEVAAHMQQSQKQPDFFEDPDASTRRIIHQAIQPYAEETRRNLMYMGKMVADARHGADKVEEAEQAFLKARSEESLDPADYERVVQSPNRYDAVVQWHRKQSVLASVGDDPAAWFEKQLEAKLADPEFQAKMLTKVRGDAASRPSEVQLPPTLSRATASKGNSAESVRDLSDAGLFAHAMGDKRR